MCITNDGSQYRIHDEHGVIVATFVEYLDAVAYIRRCNPQLGPWAHGFAPEPEAHMAQSGVAQ